MVDLQFLGLPEAYWFKTNTNPFYLNSEQIFISTGSCELSTNNEKEKKKQLKFKNNFRLEL